MAQKYGIAENFDALTGNALRDPAVIFKSLVRTCAWALNMKDCQMGVVCKMLRVLRRSGVLLCYAACSLPLTAQSPVANPGSAHTYSSSALSDSGNAPRSAEYNAVQRRLAQGWNTWDVNSVTTLVLLPKGLAIHLGMKHNTTEHSEAYLESTLIGRLSSGAEQVFPKSHAWDGSYTDLLVTWKGHSWRVQSAHDDQDVVILVTPLASQSDGALPPTAVFSVNYLWNMTGRVAKRQGVIEANDSTGSTAVYCTCDSDRKQRTIQRSAVRVEGQYFAADLTAPVGISTNSRRTVEQVQAILDRQLAAYKRSLEGPEGTQPIKDAIETTLGWDTTYEPEKQRVVSLVSRVWSVDWGGYVIFDWDTFFAATLASIGDRDLAYADAIETLRESTEEGFVPNYARAGNWKSFDRSEPPVGAITVLGLYQKFRDRWFLEETFPALLKWNRWWAQHRDLNGYLVWGSNGQNPPVNRDDPSPGTSLGAILESGLDNSPMYDGTTYNPKTHLMEFADVGLMSLYIADCDALATIADTLQRKDDANELRARSAQYGRKLETLWSPNAGIFLNKDLHTGQFSNRLSPTNFYPMLSHTATAAQARTMIQQHLRNPQEFWGDWILPSIARNDPAFADQNYWRGRIWGPLNYLVYLGLRNYDDPTARSELAQRSYELFLKEWHDKGHVHENYNAILGTGDDVANSDRFYHWGALLGYIEYLQIVEPNGRP
jgi:Mannosylglycerate hydrolase MGH1-like glycoside hydrolase domain